MRAFFRWVVGCSLGVSTFIACSSASNPGFQGEGGTDPDDSDGGGGSSSGGGFSFDATNLGDLDLLVGDGNTTAADEKCKGGQYNGTFTGNYSSHLIAGIPLSVSGNVDLTLEQEGSAAMTCMLVGESTKCSDLFSLQDGTITGVANGNDAGGGYPYFCTMSGTLDCPKGLLVDGWIECTYCVGMLADGGMACQPLISGIGGGIGGTFSGPLTANYDTNTLSFTMGTWNGAEAIGLNDGGTLVDGSKPQSYIVADGGYGITAYGGSGMWNAKWQ
ncbi:MAG: hypothetical protein ACLP1X_11710 [Polyangiaceae bacterium]